MKSNLSDTFDIIKSDKQIMSNVIIDILTKLINKYMLREISKQSSYLVEDFISKFIKSNPIYQQIQNENTKDILQIDNLDEIKNIDKQILKFAADPANKLVDIIELTNAIANVDDSSLNTNDQKLYANKCINSNSKDILTKLKFNFRTLDRNGNTVLNRLIDQYNHFAIQKILEVDPNIPTYKNNQGLDLVIANAGVAIVEDEQYNAQEAARMNMGVNYFGVINTILPCIDEMKKNQSGQIVIISSISSLRSTHNSGPYSASKAAINMWAEGARLSLKKYSINVSIIRVGFVKTKMTAKNKFKMHGIVSPAEAAKEIIEAIKKKKIDVALPWKSAYIWKVLSIIPDKFYDHIMCKLKNKIDKG
jgi:short-subunit dehydrogenase